MRGAWCRRLCSRGSYRGILSASSLLILNLLRLAVAWGQMGYAARVVSANNCQCKKIDRVD